MYGTPGAEPAVITPDAVGLDLEVASIGSRGTAYLIDAIALVTGLIVIGLGQALLGGAGFVEGWWGIAALLVLGMLWQFGYPIGFETMNHGRTPGKMVLGLRVVTVEGAPVGFRHAAIRAMTGILELLGSFGAIAIVTSFTSPRSQRLGDLAAGTLVVRERRGSREGPRAASFQPPPGLETYVASVDVRALSPADYATIRETLQRADQLPPAVRDELTRGLVARLVPRVQPPPPTTADAASVLQALAAAIQARRQPARSAPGVTSAPAGARGEPTGVGAATFGDRPAPFAAPVEPTMDGPATDDAQRSPSGGDRPPGRGVGFAPPD